MNELMQEHGCSTIFNMPEGLKELMADISREVIRAQPTDVCGFIANYLSVLLITREHGVLSVALVKDLCNCKASVAEKLMHLHIRKDVANAMADVIKKQIEDSTHTETEHVKESKIIKRLLKHFDLDEAMVAKICEIIRKAYRDYMYRKKLLEKDLQNEPEEPWEVAANHTLELYKKTHPSTRELARAAERIEAAYRGYHVRKKMLKKDSKNKKHMPKVDLPGPPADISVSRNIVLGSVLNVQVKTIDNIEQLLAAQEAEEEEEMRKALTVLDHPYYGEVEEPTELAPRPLTDSIQLMSFTSTLYASKTSSQKGFGNGNMPHRPSSSSSSTQSYHSMGGNDEIPPFEAHKINFKTNEEDEDMIFP